uniref:WH2 domain-containing protein n=1 Tax=Mesocestoides corti TaxID=53468 RepID=A0A5K3G2T4_MESCO
MSLANFTTPRPDKLLKSLPKAGPPEDMPDKYNSEVFCRKPSLDYDNLSRVPDRLSQVSHHTNLSSRSQSLSNTKFSPFASEEHKHLSKPPGLGITSSGFHSSVGGRTKPSQSINGIPVPSEDPLDVRIHRLLHSTVSGSPSSLKKSPVSKPEVDIRPRKTPLLPDAFPERPKQSPLLKNPLIPTPPPLLPVSSLDPKNDPLSSSPACSARRTLLPTPPQIEEQQVNKPSQPLSKQPLLQTPSKSTVNYSLVTRLAAETSLKFVCELRDIIQKDLERRLIERHAFREFDTWWDSQNTNELRTDASLSERLSKFSGDSSTSYQLPSASAKVVDTNSLNRRSDEPFSSTTTASYPGGLGIFSGLRAALPKIKRKPKPPVPQVKSLSPDLRHRHQRHRSSNLSKLLPRHQKRHRYKERSRRRLELSSSSSSSSSSSASRDPSPPPSDSTEPTVASPSKLAMDKTARRCLKS